MFVLFSGCMKQHFALYDIGLKEVERPAKLKEISGEHKISKIDENGIHVKTR